MQEWIDKEEWVDVSLEESAHRKMDVLQNLLVKKYCEFSPEKTRTIFSDDQPFFANKLSILKRRKSRIYHKKRKSKRWEILNDEYEAELSKAKNNYYKKKIKNLSKTKSSNGYR